MCQTSYLRGKLWSKAHFSKYPSLHNRLFINLLRLPAKARPCRIGTCVLGELSYFQSLMPPHNYLVPFFGVMSLLAVSGEMMANRIDAYMPFHRLLRCREV